MSNNPNGQRTREITPKPRRPIHSDSDMGRYALNSSNKIIRHELATHNEEKAGVDEVDNVMSKMARQSSPIPVKKRVQRTNSYTEHLQYSEDDDDDDIEDSDIDNAESSYHTQSRIEDDSYLYNRSNNPDSPQSLPYQPTYNSKPEKEPKNNNKTVYILISIILSCILAIGLKHFNMVNGMQNKATQTVNYDETVFVNNMDNLKEKYKIDDNSILKIKTGISTIFSRMDAGSFVFLYDSKTDTFDPHVFDKFINEVAHTAARYLRNEMTPMQHTVVVSSNLDMQEHGELISKYRDEVDKTGVMLVKEIDAVPSDLAMAFHYYCDEYDPLVKKSAIFFTLNLSNCSNTSDKKSTHDFVEKCLAKKWKSVPSENIRPLLTRIVDIIIDVTRVF